MLDDERWEVAHRVDDLADRTPGRSGNLSVRRGGRFAVTPTGVPYADLEPEEVPVLALAGDRVAGDTEPSSEAPMHAAVYRALNAGAVVHAHPPWATSLAVLRRPVPPVHYALARAGGAVPVADYATYGSNALAENAAETMAEARTSACLLANHGVIATGTDLDAAFETLDAVEFTAQVYARAAAIGEPVNLPPEEVDRVARKFETYGQP